MAIMNSTTLVWIDDLTVKPSPILLELERQGLKIIQTSEADLKDIEITNSDGIVVRVSTDINLVSRMRARLAHLNSTAPLIARVDRRNFELAIQAMRKGATTVVPAEQQAREDWYETLSIIENSEPHPRSAFIFADPVSRNLLALTERVAKVDVTVLLTGPTGSGKEVLAKILHDASPRHSGPFVAFNCAAMPENLVEDMLFGHEKGSLSLIHI